MRLLHQHGHDFFLRVGEVVGVEVPAPVLLPHAAQPTVVPMWITPPKPTA
ncbi:hypothetical protein [Persicitalea sp.]